ncbi:hypothetical protein IAG41_00005 [Sphingomonas sp. JC676]|uniref:hypothetical protein n=1 Tax=Sphingomonas sp. JC676 TaxID=2768065 RepID=UPI001657A399|nr:hypothetical protein [Sphingomonas sp. JC676]MBC9030763.1 hypothetical protein [Sphingomonas sp. JC676]
MLLDRRTALSALISAGAAAWGHSAKSSPAEAVFTSPGEAEIDYHILESGQRRLGPHSIAIVRSRYLARHEEALANLAGSAGYARMLSYRSSDRSKLRFSRMAMRYVMRQPDIYFSMMFVPHAAHLAKGQSWLALIDKEYADFLKAVPQRAGNGILAWKCGTPSRVPYIAVAEKLLGPEWRERVHYDVTAQSRFMQVSSLILGALTASLAGLEVRGTKAIVRAALKQSSGTQDLSRAALHRTGKFRIHIAELGAAAAGSEATGSAAAHRS